MSEPENSMRVPPKIGTIKLITAGRITGLPHVVELRYTHQDDSFYVLAGRANTDWVSNALKSESSKVHVGGLVFKVEASVASEKERKSVSEDFVRRYGRRVVKDWYADAEIALRLRQKGPPSLKGEVGGELDSKSSFGAWQSRHLKYESEVSAAFNSASEEYDFTISRNFVNTWIRSRSISLLLKYIRRSDTLLEIGCGTGAEAIKISPHVRRIFATDVAKGMIGLLRLKIKARRLENIVPIEVRASEIARVREYLPDHKVRIAYSFNGALNCEPHLIEFVRGVSSVLEEDGYLICSIRNRLCITEALSHAVALQFGRLNPRKFQPIMVSVGGRDIPSTYYAPSEFVDFFRVEFKLRKTIALPALLPPAYLNSYYVRFRHVMSILERLEPYLGGSFPLNRLGDQTLFVFQKM